MATIDRSFWRSCRIYLYDDFQTPVNRPTLGTTTKFVNRRTGVENPKWREQVQNHQNATTPLTGDKCDWRGGSGFHRLFGVWNKAAGTWATGGPNPWKQDWRGNYAMYAHTVPSLNMFASTADARARARAYSSIRKAQVKVSGPTFLGELRQTMHQLRHPAGALGQKADSYLKRVKKSRGKPGSDSWNKAVSQAWLEYSFGWVPLMSDIEDARDAYNSLINKEVVEHFSVGAEDRRRSIEILNDVQLVLAGGYLYSHLDVVQDDLHQVRYRGAVTSRAATTMSDRFARFGFTPSEFIPTAWELLPWSFLIDYFTNVGDLLTSLVTSTADLRWLNMTDRRTAVNTRTVRPNIPLTRSLIPPAAYVGQSSRPSWSEITRSRVIRSVGVGLSPPPIITEWPSAERSPLKWLNIAALLNQARDVHPQRTTGRSWRR